MARLPASYDLSQPANLRSGRQIASADTSGLGRGLAALGGAISDIGADVARQRTATEGIAADGGALRETNDFIRTFDEDGDYATFGKRAEEGLGKIKAKYAGKITSPEARRTWEAEYDRRAESARSKIADLGERRIREGRLVDAKTGLDGYRSVIADPDASEEERVAARTNAEASINVMRDNGLLTPSEADRWREDVIDGADFVFGQREIERDPSIVTGKLPARVADRSAIAMARLQSRGWSKEQAAGIVGNLLGESSLNANAVNPGDGADGSDSIGLAQWNGPRARALKQFAADQGKDWRDLELQLDFIDHEIRTSPSERKAFEALMNAKDVQSAAEAFIMYERPQGSDKGVRNAHNYKGRVQYAHQAAGETIRPDWYLKQSPERQMQLENMAAARDREIVAQDVAERKATQAEANNDYRLRIATNDPTLTQQQILDDVRLDDGNRASLINSFNEQQKGELAISQALPLFERGELTLDPYATESKKIVDGIQDRISKLVAPERQQGATEELIRQTGVVPQSTFNGVRAGLDSTDVAQVQAAAQQATRISQINPAALSRRDGGAGVQQKADDFTYYVNTLNMTPEQAAAKLAEANNPDKQRERKALEPAAKEFAKDIEGDDLADLFDESWLPFTDPQVGFTESQALGIRAEYQAIAQEQFYQANGDAEVAKNRAKQEMKRLYGVTNITGRPVVMKYPPERFWPQDTSNKGGLLGIGADPLGYAKTQLFQELYEDDPEFDPQSIQYVATPATAAMVKRGELPAYAIFYKDRNGVLQTFPGKLWRPDLKNPQRSMQQDKDRRTQTAQERDEYIRATAGREKSLDNFLEGDPLTGLPREEDQQ